jgi:hypothetical protein
MKRYPLAPLLALTRSPETGLRMSNGELGDLLGLSACAVQKWQTAGLTDRRADQAAVALGFDPYTVWPELMDELIASQSKPCENCKEPFVPTNKRQRFCTTNCRTAAWHRMNYARNEAVRAKRKADRVAYYEVAGEYERKRERARYRANPEPARQRARDARAREHEAVTTVAVVRTTELGRMGT